MYDVLPMTLLMLTGMFLILIVLLQRGRGGGLAGAFGGAGGQSAFGTKAGDVFTKITVVVAVVWVALAGASGFGLRAGAEKYGSKLPETSGIRSTETVPDDEETPPVTPATKDKDSESDNGEQGSTEPTTDGDTDADDSGAADSATGENEDDAS